MSRSLTTTVRNALAAEHVIHVLLVQLDLQSATQRYTTAGHDIEYDGHTWVGAGGLAAFDEITEGIDLQARGVRASLSGIPAALVSQALSEPVQGRRMRVWLAVLNVTTHAVLASPVLEWDGRIDTMQISDRPAMSGL